MKILHNTAIIAKTCLVLSILAIVQPHAVFSAPPERIVSLAPSTTEILFDLGVGNRIVAVTTFCDYPPAAQSKPKIGGFANPSLESIVAAKPDLVVMTDDGNPREIHDRLTKLGIATYAFRAKRIAELPRGMREMGAALGIERQAAKRAARVEEMIRRHETKLQKAPPAYFRKKVMFVINSEPLMIAGPGTVIDDALKLIGLQNIASRTGPTYQRYSLEEVIRQSPDIIFIGQGQMIGGSPKNLLKRLTGLDAVKKGRVYYTSQALYRLTPRLVTGMQEIEEYLKVF
jgi:iron complex transport system substrate-binding protein